MLRADDQYFKSESPRLSTNRIPNISDPRLCSITVKPKSLWSVKKQRKILLTQLQITENAQKARVPWSVSQFFPVK